MAPKPKLDKATIIDTAYAFVDQHGLDALSMRKLASELNVKAMSLYNHVENKDEVLDLLVERLVSEFELPQQGVPWQTAMKQRATSMHAVLMKHPWGTMPLVSRVNIGPIFLRFFDRSIACLKDSGFSYEEADRVIVALNGYIYGFTLAQLNFPLAEEDYVDAANEHIDLFPQDVYPALYGLSKDIRETKYSGIADFQLGLAFLLAGIELRYQKQ